MKTVLFRKAASFLGVLSLLALFIFPQSPVNAAGATLSIRPDQQSVLIGQTLHVSISIINNGPNPIQVSSLLCPPQGGALRGSAINPFPGLIAPNATFTTSESYLAIFEGTQQIVCQLTATDTVTHEQFTAVSNGFLGKVTAPTLLAFTAYSSTNLLNVGETVVITAKYVNHGNTPFTNIQIDCDKIGPALTFVSGQAPLQTLPAGWSQFIQQTWKATSSGSGLTICLIFATDSTGHQVSLQSPPIDIRVR